MIAKITKYPILKVPKCFFFLSQEKQLRKYYNKEINSTKKNKN